MPANPTLLTPPAEPALPPDQERSLQELALVLGETAGFRLALATFSDLKRRANIIQRLTDLLNQQGVMLSLLELSAGEPKASLLQSLKAHLKTIQTLSGQRRAVTVIGLENLIALDRVAGGPPTEGVRLLEEANLHRDAFAQACPLPLLLWLTPADTTAFAQSATDLWHWRSATFDFSSDSADLAGVMDNFTERNRPFGSPDSPDRLRERSALLRRQLAELQTSSHAHTLRVLSQRANLLGELGEVYEDLAEFDQARPCLEERLSIAEQIEDERHIALALHGLAQWHFTTGQFDKAEPLMRRALAIDEKAFGPGHLKVAAGLNNLAALLHATNRLPEAEPILRRALAIEQEAFGPEHPNIVINLHNLAALLKNTNRLSEAEPLIRRALVICERGFGPEHPRVAMCLSNLAQLLSTSNRLAEAEPLMRRALAIAEKSFGPEHPSIAAPLNNLAALLQATQRVAEAEPLIRRAVAILENALGKNHPNVAITINNLANLLKETGRLAEAENLYRRALAIDESSFGSDHPTVAIRLNNLSTVLSAANRLAEAVPLMERSLSIFRKFKQATGHPHPDWPTASANYKAMLAAMNLSPSEIEARLQAALE